MNWTTTPVKEEIIVGLNRKKGEQNERERERERERAREGGKRESERTSERASEREREGGREEGRERQRDSRDRERGRGGCWRGAYLPPSNPFPPRPPSPRPIGPGTAAAQLHPSTDSSRGTRHPTHFPAADRATSGKHVA